MSNTIINRIHPEEHGYSTVSNEILSNINLSADSVRLLCCLLNDISDSTLVMYTYADRFGWSEYKQARVIKNLEENGYLKKIHVSRGRGKFEYLYTICEKGSLKD
jgi:predicted transcriptional regulator